MFFGTVNNWGSRQHPENLFGPADRENSSIEVTIRKDGQVSPAGLS